MKLLSIVLLAGCVFYTIHAQEREPQWMMPLYFEDANGDKDTVYIGYDTSAGDGVYDIDPAFNEGWIKVDTTKFNVFLWMYPNEPPVGSYEIFSDSVRKKDITSFPYPNAHIGFTKGKMPIILKWVDSLLYSSKLPFPDITPRPRARIDLYGESGEPPYFNFPIEFEPYSLTDYPTEDLLFPVTDSILFDGSGSDYYIPRRAIFNVSAMIVPHNKSFVRTKEHKENRFIIHPNPFTDYFTITNPGSEKLDVALFSSAGEQIFHSITTQSLITVNSGSFPRGFYILMIFTYYSYNSFKLIKTN